MIDSDFELIDLITGYQPAAAITAALRVGLFDVLTRTPKSSQQLAADLNVDEPSLEALLDALAAIGLTHEKDGGFTTTSFVAERLAQGGPLASIVEKEAFFAVAWQELDAVIRTGEPVIMSWRDRLESDPSTARAFLEALDVLAEISGPPVEELPELVPDKRVVDIGAGLGSYSKKIAAAGSDVLLVDLPPVIEWARKQLNEGQLDIEFIATDVFRDLADAIPKESVDAALVSHMLHDLSPGRAVDLLESVHEVLRPGGHVVVNDFAGDSGPRAFGPLFNLMMRVETGGAAHKIDRLQEFLRRAGFTDVRQVEYEEPLTVLVARKPETD